jgi:DNA polymerase-3 subunit beta
VLSATNLEFSIITSIHAEVEHEGEITMPAKAMQNFTQYMTDETLLLETVESMQLRCVSPTIKTVIIGGAASEYPSITPIERGVSIEVPLHEFLQALHLTTFSSAKTTTRPTLSGVLFLGGGKEVTIVATDSYRLSEYVISLEQSIPSLSCIIPARVLEELCGIVSATKDEKETINLTLSAQQVEIRSQETRFLSRLIEGKFPDYKQILPKKAETKAKIPLQALTMHLRRMHYFAKEVNNTIVFSLSAHTLHLRTQKTQLGVDESLLPVTIQGGDSKIALSSSYLLDFLWRLHGEEILLEMTDSLHPAILRSPQLPSFLHLIMPLRLAEGEKEETPSS